MEYLVAVLVAAAGIAWLVLRAVMRPPERRQGAAIVGDGASVPEAIADALTAEERRLRNRRNRCKDCWGRGVIRRSWFKGRTIRMKCHCVDTSIVRVAVDRKRRPA